MTTSLGSGPMSAAMRKAGQYTAWKARISLPGVAINVIS